MSAIAEVQETKEQKLAFKKIVMAADFSAASECALAHAIALARMYNAELSLVHAISPESFGLVLMDPLARELDHERLLAEREMQRLELEVEQKDLVHHILIERGSVWNVLSSVINREHPDLLVLGTHGRGALAKLVLGSVAEEVLRSAPCPALTVGPKATPPAAYPVSFKCVLFATDFGPASGKALSYALSITQKYEAKLVLLHVVPPMAGTMAVGAYCSEAYIVEDVAECEARAREESLRKLEELVPFNAPLATKPEYVVTTNFLPGGILEMAETAKADLIVLGVSHTLSAGLAAHMPGVVIHDVLCGAKCPVLTVGD